MPHTDIYDEMVELVKEVKNVQVRYRLAKAFAAFATKHDKSFDERAFLARCGFSK